MARASIELGPFLDGVNITDRVTRLTPRELSLCRNYRIGLQGDIYKRPGHGNYGTSPAKVNGDNLVNLVLRYYKADGTKKLIAAAGGLLKFGNDTTGAWSNIDINGTGATMHTSNLCDWIVYKDRLYITDGTRVQRYNGTDDIFAGHFIHAAPTLAQPSAGSVPNGTYKYFVTSVTSDMGEGPKGAEASITVTSGPKQVDLSAMAAAPAKHNETHKNIYRTKVGGSLFYFLVQIPTGTTTHPDNAVDGSLDVEYIPTHRPPDDSRFCIIGHDDRAYYFGRSGANASLVDVSDVGFPDRIRDADGFFAVANNDGDVITGGALTPAGIVFFKRNSIWLSRGFGFGLINIRPREKRGASAGCTAPFSAVTTPVGLIFLSQRGEIYLYDGANLTEIGRKIYSEFQGMLEATYSKVVACYHDYRYIISFDWRGLKGYNNRTWEYDIRTGRWEGPHENLDFFTPSYYSVFDSTLDKGELYWGEAKAGNGSYVYGRGEGTLTDRGNKFLSRIRTGAYLNKLGEIKTSKVFVDAEIYSDASLVFEHVDENNVVVNTSLNSPIPATASKWNSGDNLGPGAPVAKFGDIIMTVLSNSIEIGARSRKPVYGIHDGGQGVSSRINAVSIIVETLDLK